MKNVISLSFGIVVVLMLHACGGRVEEGATGATQKEGASENQSGAPKIVTVQDTFDFGKVKQGESVEHTFIVRNEGTSDLFLLSAKGS